MLKRNHQPATRVTGFTNRAAGTDLRRAFIEELERRTLLSGDVDPALVPLIQEPLAHSDAASYEYLGGGAAADAVEIAPRHEVVFLDTATPDYEVLFADILAQQREGRHIEVITFDSNRDGIAQITAALQDHHDISAIHIISHGSDGSLQLGDASLDYESLLANIDRISAWGAALNTHADILLYGCDVAASSAGRTLVDRLAELTGADVNASEDPTGAAALGGDWTLEYRTGAIESELAVSTLAQAGWAGLLAAPQIDLDSNDSSAATGADYTAQYPVAGGSLPITGIDATVTDSDSTTLASLTVTLTNRLDGVNESLSADTTGTSIIASYNAGTAVLTLSGLDTVGNYMRVLRTLAYDNGDTTPDRTDRMITFVANDGTGNSNVVTATVSYWENVRDDFNPNGYAGNDGSVNWTTNWLEVNDDNNATTGQVTASSNVLNRNIPVDLLGVEPARGAEREADLSQGGSATLSFDYRLTAAGLLASTRIDVQISDNGGGSWTTLLSTSDGTLLLSDTGWNTATVDISAYASAITRVRFLVDPQGVLALSGSAQFDNVGISYDAHGAPPVLDLDANDSSGASGANYATSFTEGTAVLVSDSADARLTDTDSTALNELVATIANPLDGTAESLSANTTGTGITATFDSATATLTLSGVDSVANYQQVLRTITYNNTSQNPNATSRTIAFAASDGIDHSSTAVTTVTVNAVNDAPVITSDGGGPTASVAVAENTTAVTTVTASDVDGGALSYAISGGADAALFSIDAASGGLRFTTAPDFEAPADANADNLYEVTVQVSDGLGGSDTQALSVTVTDTNETPTDIAPNSFSLAENTDTGGGYSVGTLSASDPDGSETFTYSIRPGGDAAVFSIGGAGSNELILTDGMLNFEAKPIYTVTVRVTDSAGNFYDETLTVAVSDVNEAPLVSDQGFSVAENSANGTAVGIVAATDPDATDPLTYSITAGNSAGAFAINPGSGEITVANAAALDFETTPAFSLTVEVQDAAGLTDTATVTVSLTNVNEAPVITSDGGGATASIAVAENTTAVTTVTASDVDGGALSYAISGGADAALFSIDAASGGLRFTTAPDFEAPADANADNLYEVTVQVSDGLGGSDTQALSVAVTNVNETLPNEAPQNTVPATQNVNEDTTLLFSSGNGNLMSIADVDAGSGPVQVTLTSTNGTLTLNGLTGLTFTAGDGSADGTMTFTGTIADINAALDGLSLAPNANYSGSATLEITTDDQGNTGSGGALSDTDSVSITFNAINDVPVVTAPGLQTTSAGTAVVFSNGNAIVVTDVDAGSGPVRVSVTATNGLLTLSDTTGLTFLAGDGIADASITVTGTLADINRALNGMSFAFDSETVAIGSVTVAVSDLGNSGAGAPLSAAATVAVRQDMPVVAPPVVMPPPSDAPPPPQLPEEGGDGALPGGGIGVGGAIEDSDPPRDPLSNDEDLIPLPRGSHESGSDGSTGPDPTDQLGDYPDIIGSGRPIGDEMTDNDDGDSARLSSTYALLLKIAGAPSARVVTGVESVTNLDGSRTADSDSSALDRALDRFREDMDESLRSQVTSERFKTLGFLSASLALSAGYLNWLLRGRSLVASVVASMALWRHLDPLPVVKRGQKAKRVQSTDHASGKDEHEAEAARLLDRQPVN